MKKIRKIVIDGNMILGSTVTINVFLDYATETGDYVKITIEDPNDTIIVDWASMTKITNKIYQYTYQSSTTENYGEYEVTIKATSGSSVIYDQTTFELVDQELLR